MSTREGFRARPDLSRRALLALLGVAAPCIVVALVAGGGELPGTQWRQGVAVLGSLLLFTPALFSIVKRAALTVSPPTWFVLHVLASVLGAILIAWHIAGGAWLSPPGVLYLALLFLVVQGVSARAFLALGSSGMFASKVDSFRPSDPALRARLAMSIRDKEALLERLDPAASEALFSPHLGHWFRRPLVTARYARLAAAEAGLVGARAAAGPMLAYWRRLHIAVAYLFLAGLLLHVVLVMFFAGYVSEGGEIYWWHVTDWGGPG